jgi:hypothetical protein
MVKVKRLGGLAGKAIVTVALTASLALPAEAAIRYVDDSAPPGGNGSSWRTAFGTLQGG